MTTQNTPQRITDNIHTHKAITTYSHLTYGKKHALER